MAGSSELGRGEGRPVRRPARVPEDGPERTRPGLSERPTPGRSAAYGAWPRPMSGDRR
jgi:hypothetical protein